MNNIQSVTEAELYNILDEAQYDRAIVHITNSQDPQGTQHYNNILSNIVDQLEDVYIFNVEVSHRLTQRYHLKYAPALVILEDFEVVYTTHKSLQSYDNIAQALTDLDWI